MDSRKPRRDTEQPIVELPNPSLQPTRYGWLRQASRAAELKRWAARRERAAVVELQAKDAALHDAHGRIR